MLLTISVLAIVAVVLAFYSIDLRHDNKALYERLEAAELALAAEKREHELLAAEVYKLHHPEPITAAEIVERAAKRLRLRKSPSEQAWDMEQSHKENERHHESIVRNIEDVAPLDIRNKI